MADQKLSDLTALPTPITTGDLLYVVRSGVDYKAASTDIPSGSGTVTSVSVTTVNGVSGSVATATTTPAISLTLGAITPTSVNAVVLSGASTPTLAVTGTSSVSGANTGDQSSVSGNAGTATALATARTIGGSSFDGTANVTSFPSPGAIGGSTPAAGAFTTLSATGQVTSTLATGTAPLVVASTTEVANLKAATATLAATATSVADSGVAFTDITTGDSSTTKHGFLDKLPGGTTTFKRADGAWATPAGTAASYVATAFSGQTTVTVTHNFGAYPLVDVVDNSASPAVIVPLTITHGSVNAFTVTFTASSTGTILASLGSPQPHTYVAVSGTYAILSSDYFIEATSGTFTATLPTAVGRAGQEYTIKNSGTGIVTIATTSSQTIDGQLTNLLAVQYQSITVVSNGANWFVI